MTQQINLFNPAFLKQKKIFTTRTMANSLALLLVGAMAVVLYGRLHTAELALRAEEGAARLAKKKQQQEKVLAEFAPRKKDGGLEAMIDAAQTEQAALRNVLALLDGGGLGNIAGHSRYFAALARQSTGDLWLTGVTIEAAGSQIGLRGRALEPERVPAYIARLTREPVMQGKEFGSLEISRANITIAATSDTPAAAELAPYIDFNLRATGPIAAKAEVSKVPLASDELNSVSKAIAEAGK